MRYALISDIHSNLTALEAVFDHLKDRGTLDKVWCMGDVVGYGPDPNECVEFLRGLSLTCVMGNHDLGSLGRLDLSEFNPAAAYACRWTMGELTSDSKQFLSSLPQTVTEGDYTLVHASPRNPVWEYLVSAREAKANFRYFSTNHCLVGHTHVPALFIYSTETGDCSEAALPLETDIRVPSAKERLIVNPGSIGQPRDGDPRASYAILDTGTSTLTLYRVPYDIGAVQKRIRSRGLPEILADRLSYGW